MMEHPNAVPYYSENKNSHDAFFNVEHRSNNTKTIPKKLDVGACMVIISYRRFVGYKRTWTKPHLKDNGTAIPRRYCLIATCSTCPFTRASWGTVRKDSGEEATIKRQRARASFTTMLLGNSWYQTKSLCLKNNSSRWQLRPELYHQPLTVREKWTMWKIVTGYSPAFKDVFDKASLSPATFGANFPRGSQECRPKYVN